METQIKTIRCRLLTACWILSLFFMKTRGSSVDTSAGLEDSQPAEIALSEGASAAETLEDTAGYPGSWLSHELLFDSEWMGNDDFKLTQSTAAYRMDFSMLQLNGSIALNTYDLNFQSPDAFTRPDTLEETRLAAQLNGRARLNPKVEMLFGGGVYDGFSDYRSVWFDTYFKQLYGDPSLLSIPGFDTYREADPKGWNGLFGFRTEYLPSVAFLEVQGQYLNDRISPGYEIDFGGLLRNRDRLNTGIVSVSSENILTQRIRSRLDYRLTKTSERHSRHFIQAALNVSLSDRWVSRNYAGYSTEDPTFQAEFFGTGIEYDLSDSLTLSLVGRYYRDTGEIENSLLFTSAVPGVETLQLGLGFRYHRPGYALRLMVTPYYYVDYEPIQTGSEFFSHLYEARHWALVQLAVEFKWFK